VAIEVTSTEAGKKPGDPTSRIDRQLIVLNSMTPETANTCHYFWAHSRNYQVDDAEFHEAAFRGIVIAHTEDKSILEAAQRIIDLDSAAPQVDVTDDRGGLAARRLIERLIAEERGLRAAAE
jgi:vanillate O-demethylase monooxygenase subunit